jgi:hypothetical protein
VGVPMIIEWMKVDMDTPDCKKTAEWFSDANRAS